MSFFNDFASEMLYPIMPLYLQSIGFSVALIGVLEGLAEAIAGLSKGYFGYLSDIYQKRVPFVRAGYILTAISKPLMAIFTNVWWVFAIRTTDRLGKGVRTGARDAILSDETTLENKGKVFGFHRAFDTLGAAVGPFVALIFLFYFPVSLHGNNSYRWLFFIAFIPGLIAIALTYKLRESKKILSNTDNLSKTKNVPFWKYFSYWNKSTAQYKRLAIGLLFFTLFNSSDAFILLQIKAQTNNDTLVIGAYIFYNLIFALMAFPLGSLADKIGLKTVLIIGLLLFAASYIGFGLSTTITHFVIMLFIYGLFSAATDGVQKALLTNYASSAETATAIGLYTSLGSICTMLASSIGGIIFLFNPAIMFIISAIAALIAAMYLIFTLKKS